MRSEISKPMRVNYYNDFKNILHENYSLIGKRLLNPLHKTHMKKYLRLVKESQILDAALNILDGKYINEILNDLIGEMENQKEELFQALIDSKAILMDSEAISDSEI